MEISDYISNLARDVLIFVGNYGSGKTEVAVNFTLELQKYREQVTIVDLDIVNPYFRCREARDLLRYRSINVIIPGEEQLWTDLPIILPEIKGHIEHPQGTVVLDVGGDDVGARVLGMFKPVFQTAGWHLWLVLNASRPFTADLEGCLKLVREIERACQLKIDGLVANTHLMEYTTAETIYQGYALTEQVASALQVPIVFVAVEQRLQGQIDPQNFTAPLFWLQRYLLPPWKS